MLAAVAAHAAPPSPAPAAAPSAAAQKAGATKEGGQKDGQKEMKAGEAPKAMTTPQFEALKKLEGTWVGKAVHGETSSDATVSYKITSGGTAVAETLFAGTPHEMVTVYHLEGDQLVLTHYCAAGNQPKMKARAAKDAKVIDFEFAGGTNIKPGQSHMHSAQLRLADANKLESTWASFVDDKKVSEAKFVLERKK